MFRSCAGVGYQLLYVASRLMPLTPFSFCFFFEPDSAADNQEYLDSTQLHPERHVARLSRVLVLCFQKARFVRVHKMGFVSFLILST